jgi:hypothetical protein
MYQHARSVDHAGKAVQQQLYSCSIDLVPAGTRCPLRSVMWMGVDHPHSSTLRQSSGCLLRMLRAAVAARPRAAQQPPL